MIDQLPVLQSRGLRMCKRWNTGGGTDDYELAKHFTPTSVSVDGIRSLAAELEKLEKDPCACVIRGALKKAPPIDGYVRRSQDFFADTPRHWAMFDFDSVKTTIDWQTDPEGAIRECVNTHLPPAFHNATFWYQFSNSAGHPAKPGLRFHAWFWLSQPRTGAALHAWAKAHALPVDLSVFHEVQVHYTAAPIFADSIADPIAKRSGLIEGSPA